MRTVSREAAERGGGVGGGGVDQLIPTPQKLHEDWTAHLLLPSTRKLIGLLAIKQENKGGHGTHRVPLGQLVLSVHVDLEEDRLVGILCAV